MRKYLAITTTGLPEETSQGVYLIAADSKEEASRILHEELSGLFETIVSITYVRGRTKGFISKRHPTVTHRVSVPSHEFFTF